jgi:hypothetical protein
MNSLYEGTYIRNIVPVEDSKRIGKLVILLNSILPSFVTNSWPVVITLRYFFDGDSITTSLFSNSTYLY